AGERRADADRADARLRGQLREIARRVGGHADIVGRTDVAEARLREARVVDDDRPGTQADETGREVERDDVNIFVQNRADRDVATRRVRAVVGSGDVVGDRQDVDRAAGADYAARDLAAELRHVDGVVRRDTDVMARGDARPGMDDGGGARRHRSAVLERGNGRLRRRVRVDAAVGRLRPGIHLVGVGVGVAAAVVAEVAQALGDHPGPGLRLLGGVAVGITVVVVDAAGAVAAVVAVGLVQ